MYLIVFGVFGMIALAIISLHWLSAPRAFNSKGLQKRPLIMLLTDANIETKL